MKPKEKAKQLIDKFKDHVNPYVGSGMLSNTHDDDTILWQCKQCALITVDYLLQQTTTQKEIDYWNEVKLEIDKQSILNTDLK